MAEVTPTVTALRQRAADVVEAELLRLDNRLPGLDSTHRDEVARTVRRVVDKLLHAPTVRVKQLASAPGGDTYAEALRELFELDPTPSTPSPLRANCLWWQRNSMPTPARITSRAWLRT